MQGGDQQCNHTGICSTSPCKHTKAFLPLGAFWWFAKAHHCLWTEKEGDRDSYPWEYSRQGLKWAWGCSQVHWDVLTVWCETHTNTVLCHNPKGLQNFVVITCKCNLYSAGGRFFGTYFKKLLDMMSISTLLEPLNILSGNPASESLLLWRYTDLLGGSKR